MIDSKEVARGKAEAKALSVIDRAYVTIDEKKDRFEVKYNADSVLHEFPFTDLKDGDLCMMRGNMRGLVRRDFYPSFYHEGSFYTNYEDNMWQRCYELSDHSVFIAKTGFNILEHLKEQS